MVDGLLTILGLRDCNAGPSKYQPYQLSVGLAIVDQ